MAAGPISERNQDATIYVGGLDEKVAIFTGTEMLFHKYSNTKKENKISPANKHFL